MKRVFLIISITSFLGCAGGSVGTGVRKISDANKLDASTTVSPLSRLQKLFTSTAGVCEFEEVTITLAPLTTPKSVRVDDNCYLTFAPEDEFVRVSVEPNALQDFNLTLEVRNRSGIWSELSTLPANQNEPNQEAILASRALVRGNEYRLHIRNKHSHISRYITLDLSLTKEQ